MPTDEDCLSLNVWFPASAAKKALPVMLWIHGGGFILGSGSQSIYDGTELATRDVVVVTINYRLGPLGWMAHSGLLHQNPKHPASGNYGLLDQIAALEWVRDNIAGFGGDPKQVTIFGESAGGVSVCALFASPAANGLFVRAIDESGPCLSAATMSDLTTAESQGDRLAMALSCSTAPDVVACMRSKSASDVASALPTGILPGVAGQEGWAPIVDGDVEPTTVADAIRAGSSKNVPLLLGTNADEGSVLVAGSGLNNLDGVTSYLNQRLGPTLAAPILANYPPSRYGGDSNAAAYAIVGDGLMVCPAERAAEDLASVGGHPSAYLFSFVTSYGALLGWGAFHGSDLPFVFRNANLQPGVALATFTGANLAVSDWFEGYWTNMAKTGSPGTVSGVVWPLYAGQGGEVMNIEPQAATMHGWYHAPDCAVWKTALGALL
jgi:para-nitrobenzyl esterase